MARLVYVSDLDFKFSGYATLSVPLLTGLAKLGWEIECAGLNYRGEEHRYPFSIIPAQSVQDVTAIVNNLHYLWNPDVIMVAMDLPFQQIFSEQFKNFQRKFCCITPMENGPLCMTWAAPLLNMDAVFFISELGKQEAIKAGVTKAEHLVVGVDTVSWHPPQVDEMKQIRKGLGFTDEDFVILTVADNQERKNLSAGFEIIAKLKKQTSRPIKHVLVTREHNQFGWKLRDLALYYSISQEVQIYERGLPVKDLWGLYAASDVYLSCSKAEGLGIPVLDAMATGLPVVATDTGALHELLQDGRGFLVPPAFTTVDVWGNSKRDYIDVDCAVDAILLYMDIVSPEVPIGKALDFIRSRTWDAPVAMLDAKLKEIIGETQA